MNNLDKVLLLSDKECVLYYKNGRQLTLRSGHGRILELLDWFVAPFGWTGTYTEYLKALELGGGDTAEIDLSKIGA